MVADHPPYNSSLSIHALHPFLLSCPLPSFVSVFPFTNTSTCISPPSVPLLVFSLTPPLFCVSYSFHQHSRLSLLSLCGTPCLPSFSLYYFVSFIPFNNILACISSPCFPCLPFSTLSLQFISPKHLPVSPLPLLHTPAFPIALPSFPPFDSFHHNTHPNILSLSVPHPCLLYFSSPTSSL